ncbi:hypothetical protein M441DRAFT_295491 [Trichoderma asperellum CBS 433.97]|uniref:Uncharacterized protein n=1 Tax=Trichoderma asperellum (strain ATCC 204424 / CBS 433.97 / NBRC 101777) TaxID=1042311 RepID=A0A2T3YSI6_TRIA4|nr:hypothetical protein M441DRAFT_295491 [Trichoderma asperellum CBS 433.97]PTB35530.1 hypothetical protein M441DRAFT_295491 [Trichoderma asperellum CBS 433.97]
MASVSSPRDSLQRFVDARSLEQPLSKNPYFLTNPSLTSHPWTVHGSPQTIQPRCSPSTNPSYKLFARSS